MLTLRLVPRTEIDTITLERLWSEAYPYIDDEIERMGEETLKSKLFDLQDYPIIKYEVDGYTVGMASTSIKYFEGKNYLFYRFALFGCDQTGSRSWFYSEDNQRDIYQILKTENLAGLIIVQNPNDKVTKASTVHLGAFNKYLKPVRYVDQKEAKLLLLDDTLVICVYDILEE
jgi:hypothetical protein